MFGEGALTFREFVMGEPLPLASIHSAVLEFLRHRDDAALFGAQAVNAYVDEPRMTQDVDILSPRAADLIRELRDELGSRFHIAIRIREVADGRGHRLYQIRKPKNRHLVDVRLVSAMPPTRRIAHVLVVAPEELIAGKIVAYAARRGTPKSFSDMRDLAALLLRFPDLRTAAGPVRDRLSAAGAGADALAAWDGLLVQEIHPESEEDEF